MPELVRSIAARLREFVGNRRRAPRYRVRLTFSLSLLNTKTSLNDIRRPPTLEGYTRDISATGLALIVPAIRIGERYLTGEGGGLRIALETPSGPMQIHATSVRYEQLNEEGMKIGYLIGVRITEMSDDDRAKFMDYLRKLH